MTSLTGMDYRDQFQRLASADLLVNSGVYDLLVPGGETVIGARGLPTFASPHRSISDEEYRDLLAVTAFARVSPPEHEIAESLYAGQQGVRNDSVAGFYIGSYAGAVRDDAARAASSSGGLTTWVLRRLYETGRITGVLHLTASSAVGTLFEYSISRGVDSITSAAKTRYYPATLGRQIRDNIQASDRLAVVGIPSILYELRLLTRLRPELSERIPYFVGLICGHQKSANYALSLGWQAGIAPGDLRAIDFRAKLPGRSSSDYGTRVVGRSSQGQLVDARVRTGDMYGTDWGLGFFKANFSDFSDDVFNETADIVLGDAWLPEYVKDDRGTNVVLTRSREMDLLLREGVRSGEVWADELPIERVRRSQGGLVRHGRELIGARVRMLSRTEYVPQVRFPTNRRIDPARMEVQRLRVALSRKSHAAFEYAMREGDFSLFQKTMRPLVRRYEFAYGAAGRLSRLRNRGRR